MEDRQRLKLKWLSERELEPPTRFDAMHALLILLAFDMVLPVLKGISASVVEAAIQTSSQLSQQIPPLEESYAWVMGYVVTAITVWICATIWLRDNRLTAFQFQPTGGWFGPTLRAAGICCAVAMGLVFTYRICGIVDARQTSMVLFGATADGSSLAGSAVLVCGMLILVAPVFEEWLFRGVLSTGLGRVLNQAACMVLASLLFTFEHPILSSPGVLTLAVSNQWLVGKTGRLWPAVLVHMAYNTVVVATMNLPMA